MTAWLFYYNDPAFEGYHRLYAYTDNKEYAKTFKEDRDMDKFTCIKKKLTKDEFNQIEGRFGRLKLTYGSFYTKSEIFGKRVPVKFLCTFDEEESVIFKAEQLWDEYKDILFDASIFTDEYVKALEKLMFMKFYGFYVIKYKEYADYFYQPYYSNYGPVEGLIMEEFKNSYQYDDLRLFLKFFHKTFKLESDKKKKGSK